MTRVARQVAADFREIELQETKMMLDWLGGAEKGRGLDDAITAVIAEKKVRTNDMDENSSIRDMAKTVVAYSS